MTFIFRISRQKIRAHSVTLYVLIVSSCTDRYLIGSAQETVAIIFFNLGELNSNFILFLVNACPLIRCVKIKVRAVFK